MHIVRKQIIELKIKDPANAFFLQERASKAFFELLLPLLEQYFNGISDDKQTIYRIEKLDLNLGKISLQNFEEDLVRKIVGELAKKNVVLQKAKSAPVFSEEESEADDEAVVNLDSHNYGSDNPASFEHIEEKSERHSFELLSYFIHSGLLPWWADSEEESILDLALNKTIEQQPQQLESLLVYALKNPELLKRVIANFTESSLAQIGSILSGLPVSQVRGLPLQIETALSEQGRLMTRGKLSGHFAIWCAILSAFLASSGRSLSQEKLVEELLADIYGRNKAKLGSSSRGMLISNEMSVAQHEQLLGMAKDLLSFIEQNSRYLEAIKCDSNAIRLLILEIEANPSSILVHLRSLQEVVSQLAIAEFGDAKDEEEFMLNEKTGRLANELLVVLQQQLGDLQKKIGNFTPALSPDEKSEMASPSEETKNLLFIKESIAPQGQYRADVHDSFSEDEKIAVENAGLVLLWPYLVRFFQNLELIDEDKFITEGAQHKAIQILQYLVDSEEETREYLLPLNKLLCGAEIALIWKPQDEITTEEKEACEDLLSAVIQNAPILNNMSIQGFRDTFLKRKGLLGTLDGVYLLQAEKQTYDVVLDKVPWPFNLVKFPWMPVLMNVEW